MTDPPLRAMPQPPSGRFRGVELNAKLELVEQQILVPTHRFTPGTEATRGTGPALGYTYTTPDAFVNFCERVRGSGGAEEEGAKRVQELEWRLHFDHCYSAAQS